MDTRERTTKDKTIMSFGRIDSGSAESLLRQIREMNRDDNDFRADAMTWAKDNRVTLGEIIPDPITIILSTPGGSCYDGLTMYDAIKCSKTPVEILATGKVMSMGVIVLLASDVRRAHRSTTFMIHQVSSMSMGSLKDMEESIDETRRINDILFEIISSRTKITHEKLEELANQKKDWYITADEALDLGIITEII